jgi:phosphatidylserine/phosphatidylglycerophosphate/cardiolipin synthase-like enzyme
VFAVEDVWQRHRNSEAEMIVKFSPKGGVESLIISWILNAKRSVRMAAYCLTNEDIVNSLIIAKKHGCFVDVILDKSQTFGVQAKLHDRMVKAGISVELCKPKNGIMHDKFMIVDDGNVQTGSYNYTFNAENCNFENALFFIEPFEYCTEFTFLKQHSNKERKFGRSLVRLVRRLRT